MARESIITILRSLSADTPTGLTFGEFGFAGANRQLFIGGTGGGATVQSIWIGASITGGDISTSDGWAGGTGAYRVSTTDAVKRYVDAIAGTKGEVASINGDTGIITITGAGNSAAVSVRSTVAGTHLIDARLASTSLTGVASFDPLSFNISAVGAVSLLGDGGITVRGSDNTSDPLKLGGSLSLTASPSGAIRTTVTTLGNGNSNAEVLFDARVATSSLTGVASFHPGHFTVTNGNVVASFSGGVTFNGTVSGAVKSVNGNDGIVTITGAGNDAAVSVRSTVAGTHLIDARMASLTVTGVASFDRRHFAIGASGHVSLTGSIGADSVRIASLTVTGAASFDTRHFAVGASGHVSLTGTYQATGDTIAQTGVNSSQYINRLGNIVNLDNKIATINGQTGVASFSSNFQITNVGNVDLANDVTIAGNLTVQGDVVTANVSTITVQDPLIKLGSNNTSDIKDLGFYVQYGNNSIAGNDRFAGIFRDASDLGKFKFFEGLTNSAEMGATGMSNSQVVNTDRQGYTMATVVAKLDGGTF